MGGWERYKDLVKIAAVTAVVFLGFRFLLPLFFPFLLAYGVARLLKRPVAFLYRRLRIRPAIGGSILLLLFLAVAGGALAYGVAKLVNELVEFAGNYALYQEEVNGQMERICCYCDELFRLSEGSTFRLLGSGLSGLSKVWQEEFLPALTKKSLQAAISVTEIAAAVIIIFVAVILFLVDMNHDEGKEKGQKGKQGGNRVTGWKKEWLRIRGELSAAGIAYLKTQLILILIISAICTAGFLILKNPYALLFGVGVGIFDAFPVLGSGLILVPWAIIRFIRRDVFSGAVLLTMYGCCQFVREYLEPKLLGGKIGIRPVYSLMAVYIGYELFGISGIFLGPIGLVLIRALCRSGAES